MVLLLWALSLNGGAACAEEIRVAVSSNFTHTLKEIAGNFETRTGHEVTLSFGSTGKHYAQIRNGAPFDLFFAADTERPRRLVEEGVAMPGSLFTYAVGRVVLWSPEPGLVDSEGRVLAGGGFRYLAMANPALAPYGRAAREILEARGQWHRVEEKIVRGENIGQAFQFVQSGNAELGFVALSQVKRPGTAVGGSLWNVPQSLYSPIEQQAVLLSESAAARDFLAFVRSEPSLAVIRGSGYGVPHVE